MDDNILDYLCGGSPYAQPRQHHILLGFNDIDQLLNRITNESQIAQTKDTLNIPALLGAFNKTLKGGAVNAHFETTAQELALNHHTPFSGVRDTLTPDEQVYYDYFFPEMCRIIRANVRTGNYYNLKVTDKGVVITLTTSN